MSNQTSDSESKQDDNYTPRYFYKKITWTIRQFNFFEISTNNSRSFFRKIKSIPIYIEVQDSDSARKIKFITFSIKLLNGNLELYMKFADEDGDDKNRVESNLTYRVGFVQYNGLVCQSFGGLIKNLRATHEDLYLGHLKQIQDPKSVIRNFMNVIRKKKLEIVIDLRYCEIDKKIESGFDKNATNCCLGYESLFKNPKFSDFTIISCRGTKFKVHRGILSARSDVFEKMLSSDMKEKNEDMVIIDDIQEKALFEFLRYIYSGKVRSIDEIVLDLLHAAIKYNVLPLREICLRNMSFNLSSETVFNVLLAADLYDEKGLKKYCLDFIKWNYRYIRNSENWKLVPTHLMKELLDIALPSILACNVITIKSKFISARSS